MANREPLRRSDRRLARRVAALVGCLSVAVAACSGGGDATPTSSTQATVPIGQLPSTLVGTTLPESTKLNVVSPDWSALERSVPVFELPCLRWTSVKPLGVTTV